MWSVLVLALWGITAIYGQTRTCSSREGQVQIYQTSSFGTYDNAGRVEICMGGVWGTIAADSAATPWSEKNAQVACIEAGYSGVLNVVLQRTIRLDERSDSSPIYLSGVRCNGSERSVLDCPRLSSIPSNLNHQQDAYVVCRPQLRSYSDVHPSGPRSGDIRLFGDPRNGYGAVEIYSSTLGWQGICPDSSWTNSDAAIICQDLGYDSGTIIDPIVAISNSTNRAPFDRLTGTNCPARSGDLLSRGVCSFQSSSRCTAPLNQFAALKCSNVSERSVRLLGGGDSREGIVEIAYNGRWGMLCDNGFSTTDARSVCEGLGFGRDGASIMSLTSSSPILASESNLKPIWLTELTCSLSDSSLLACIREENVIGFTDCRNLDIAAVDCGNPPGQLSSGQITGIVIGVLSALFVIGVFGYIYGRPYWAKRHSYDWYNTITTPSSWCDCDCDCFSSSVTTTRRTTVNTTPASSSTGTTTGYVLGSDSAAATFNLTRRQSLDRQPQPQPEPEPVPEPSDPGLSKAPPPSYQAASNFPSHDLQQPTDLPPPYPGGPAPTAAAAAYPPPTVPGYPLTAPADNSYPPSWTNPAYPPPTAPSDPSELPYPPDNAPYPS